MTDSWKLPQCIKYKSIINQFIKNKKLTSRFNFKTITKYCMEKDEDEICRDLNALTYKIK